jgi:hypothetical protein
MLTSFGDVAEVIGPLLTPESVLPGAQQRMNGSLFVIEAPSIKEVKSIVESDPYYSGNVVSPLSPRFGPRIPLIWCDSGTRRRS